MSQAAAKRWQLGGLFPAHVRQAAVHGESCFGETVCDCAKRKEEKYVIDDNKGNYGDSSP